MTAYQSYFDLLKSKIVVANKSGFDVDESIFNPLLKPHQKTTAKWAIAGGCRAVFASFGLGKTFTQLSIAKVITDKYKKPFLIGLPLGVSQEFKKDAKTLGITVKYILDDSEINTDECLIYLCNYERIRTGKLNPDIFIGVSFDEASVLRGLETETTDYILKNFSSIKYRYVCTATPSPNEYTELLNYAQFLGVMDRGQALTRFFQRDSTKAGNLTIYPHKENEFWMWVSSWALFITKPSDLGFDDEGYILPKLNLHYHCVRNTNDDPIIDEDGNFKMFRDVTKSLVDAAKEKRTSLQDRINKAFEIVSNDKENHYILWHHLEDERKYIEKILPESKSVFGSQANDKKEELLLGFGNGEYKYLATKPDIAGSGCNFQHHCHKAIFCGIDYKFNDFIQALHRIYRFLQYHDCDVHIIFTENEEQILRTLLEKWQRHNDMTAKTIAIIKEYGLSNLEILKDLSRTIGVNRLEEKGENFTAVNNDCVLETDLMEDNSVDLIVTSIPFSDQYEYCESYHDMGYNDGDAGFFSQMSYLTKNLLRILKPGRIACIHVKDRIRYSYQNGAGFTSLSDFSGKTVAHFVDNGFHLMGKVTVTTDVVQENNQTYRLGWSEQCKDGSKMGVGLPEYVLIFRKQPTDTSNAYADFPVIKSKEDYTRARWQLDAHAFWRTFGNRLLSEDELKKMDLSNIYKWWEFHNKSENYHFNNHLQLCENLDNIGKLSATFMSLPVHSIHPDVWTDISRMRTLNSQQITRKQEKHVCPLQFDIVDRCIERYSNEGELVLDPFGGIMTVPYRALKLGRKGMGIELNTQYWMDGVKYLKEVESHKAIPTLFDVLNMENSSEKSIVNG